MLYAKMLKETEKKHKALFLLFLSLVVFQLGGVGGLLFPFGYAYDKLRLKKPRHGKFHSSTACSTSIGFTAGVFFR